ncbi:Dabb family protein [Fibrisoma montanum]|uniref:Dabb family protein n=1 Tax=Fibrisoma montanum TaxID=2305895 RepID=A0A418M493_9BACT|nr:Dabb family protein [Fibrisoma montanum]RIV20635.1 Dabb family protein [Fibrisoma montanum]
MNRKAIGYALVTGFFLAFALIIYGAYSPARKAQKQRIVCVKFKKGVENQAVEQHMHGFASLKHEIPQIVNYSSGRTILPDGAVADYDVMHYLTFQSEDDILAYEKSEAYRQFIERNKGAWEKILVVNADIRQ